MFFWRLPIQNHSKPPITEKGRSKTKYVTWNSIRFKSVKNTSMQKTLSKALDISNVTARVAQDLLKAWQFYQIQLWEDLQLIEKTQNHTRNRSHFSQWSTILLFKSFSKFLQNTETVLSGRQLNCRPFPILLKYQDHGWNLQTI